MSKFLAKWVAFLWLWVNGVKKSINLTFPISLGWLAPLNARLHNQAFRFHDNAKIFIV
jgi:hypothetical protein